MKLRIGIIAGFLTLFLLHLTDGSIKGFTNSDVFKRSSRQSNPMKDKETYGKQRTLGFFNGENYLGDDSFSLGYAKYNYPYSGLWNYGGWRPIYGNYGNYYGNYGYYNPYHYQKPLGYGIYGQKNWFGIPSWFYAGINLK